MRYVAVMDEFPSCLSLGQDSRRLRSRHCRFSDANAYADDGDIAWDYDKHILISVQESCERIENALRLQLDPTQNPPRRVSKRYKCHKMLSVRAQGRRLRLAGFSMITDRVSTANARHAST